VEYLVEAEANVNMRDKKDVSIWHCDTKYCWFDYLIPFLDTKKFAYVINPKNVLETCATLTCLILLNFWFSEELACLQALKFPE